MEDTQPRSVGILALLDEITEDLDVLKGKHSGYYSLSMWWQLEKHKLVKKYASASLVETIPERKRARWKRRSGLPGYWLDVLVVLGMAVVVLGYLTA